MSAEPDENGELIDEFGDEIDECVECPRCGGSGLTPEGWDCDCCDGTGDLPL